MGQHPLKQERKFFDETEIGLQKKPCTQKIVKEEITDLVQKG